MCDSFWCISIFKLTIHHKWKPNCFHQSPSRLNFNRGRTLILKKVSILFVALDIWFLENALDSYNFWPFSLPQLCFLHNCWLDFFRQGLLVTCSVLSGVQIFFKKNYIPCDGIMMFRERQNAVKCVISLY